MKNTTLVAIFSTSLLVFLPMIPMASMAQAQNEVAFSATAVQTLPDGSEQVGRITKSGQNMRLERIMDGQTSVQIMRGAEGIAYLVDLQNQTYAKIMDASVARAVSGASSPCPPVDEMQAAGLSCERVGEGRVSGIITQSWELRMQQSGDVIRVEWDSGRRRALSQSWPDGSSMVMTFLAMQDIEGRAAEYWSSSIKTPGQPAELGGWWFDAALRVVLREKLPGGIMRQLTDIVVGPVDPAEFWPPEGFSAVAAQSLQPVGQ